MTEEEKSINEEINNILKSRTTYVRENFFKIRFQYNNGYNLPEIDPIRHEICLDILFGLYQSALTLTNHLLESFLKIALIYKDYFDDFDKRKTTEKEVDIDNMVKQLADELKPYNEKYNGKDLSYTINRACTTGLISKEEKQQLHEFRERFRNPYGHADRKKQYGGITTPVQGGTIKDDELVFGSATEIEVFGLPFFQGIAQWHHAEAYSFPYFEYLDNLIRKTLKKIFPGIDKNPIEEL